MAKAAFEDGLDELLSKIDGVKKTILCLTDSGNIFRKDIWPGYKAKRKRKPLALKPLKDWLLHETKHHTYLRPRLEADDIVGILATSKKIVPGEKLIVSIDKDLLQIPGTHLNPDKDDGPFKVTEEEGFYHHLVQTLTGDTTDEYPGCPGIGPKKAEAILFGASPPFGTHAEAWRAVVKAFEKTGLDEEAALIQARTARILTADLYDFKRKEPKLWEPPSSV